MLVFSFPFLPFAFLPNRSIRLELVGDIVVSGAPVQLRVAGTVAVDSPVVDVGSYTIKVQVSWVLTCYLLSNGARKIVNVGNLGFVERYCDLSIAH